VLGTIGSPQTGQIIESGVAIPVVGNSTDPGQDIISNTFTVQSSGNYYLTTNWVSAYPNSWLRLDNYTLEREVMITPPNFTLTKQGETEPIDQVFVELEESVTLCLTPDEAPTTDISINIAPNGGGNPHYPAFIATLDFPANNTNQLCFNLNQEPGITDEANYLFEAKFGDEVLLDFEVVVYDCENFAGPDRVVCEGELVQLGTGCLPEPHPEDGISYCYRWEPADGLDDPAAVMPTLTPTEDNTYFVYVTTSEGEYIGQDDVHVTVDYPTIEVASTSKIICTNESTTLSTETIEGWEYTWFRDGIIINGATTSSITVTEGGLYTVEGKAENGCISRGEINIGSSADPDALANTFEDEGFVCIAVTIEDEGSSAERSMSCDNYVEDNTGGLGFRFAGSTSVITNLACLLDDFLANANVCGDNLTGLITMDDNICQEEGFFENNNSSFENVDAGYWVHFLYREGPDDCMVIRVNTQEGIETDFENFGLYLNELVTTVSGDDDLYGYASKDDQLLNIMFSEALNAYVDSIPYVENNLNNHVHPVLDAPYAPVGPCATNNPVIGVSPSGMPVWIETGANISFGVVKEYEDKIDDTALTAFTLNDPNGYKGRFRAGVKKGCNEFAGYFNQLKPDDPPYQFNPQFLGTSPAKVVWGKLRPLPCPLKHVEVIYANYDFTPADADSIAVGDGSLVQEIPFDYYFPANGEPPGYSLMLCQAEISAASLNQPLAVNLKPAFHPPGSTDGWLFTVKNAANGVDFVYGYLDNDGETFVYLRYNCAAGEWLFFDEPEHEEMLNFLSALAKTVNDVGHTTLDIIGFLPVAGDVVDGVNAVWYSIEGNYTEAAISVAAIGIGVATVAKYKPDGLIIERSGQVVKDFLSAIKVVLTQSPSTYRGISGWREMNRMKTAGLSATETARCWDWLHGIIKTSGTDGHAAIVVTAINQGNNKFYKTWKSANRSGLSNDQMTELFKDITKNDPIDVLVNPSSVTNADEMMDFFLSNTNGLSAWKALDLLGHPLKGNLSALKVVSEPTFAIRLGSNPNLINYLEVLTDAGRNSLTDNIDEWAKYYDVRSPLKNGDTDEAVNILGGTLGNPSPHNGANYVRPLTPSQAAVLDDVVNSSDDIANLANHLGLDPQIVQTAKHHLFISDEHLVPTGTGVYTKGRFDAAEIIATKWLEVANNPVSNSANDIKAIIAHEYIEAKLMKEGIIFRTQNGPSAYEYGAHFLSIRDDPFNFDFNHWSSAMILNRNAPTFSLSLSSSFQNIDDIVNQILTIEGIL
jgi:hypothetical protein